MNKEFEIMNGFMGMGLVGVLKVKVLIDINCFNIQGEVMLWFLVFEILQFRMICFCFYLNVIDDFVWVIMKDNMVEFVFKFNIVWKLENIDDMYKKNDVKFWQFWKEFFGGYVFFVF